MVFELAVGVSSEEAQSEDCLYLNVRTANLGGAGKQPVMVWIHGGGHQTGSGSNQFYQSDALTQRGVVLVNLNYRLGLIGYFAHPALSAESKHGVSGNYGTLDQIAALRWVRDNIAAFGGDPSKVTIFGESAGGESVAHMMTSPMARGLFHRAIMQSASTGGLLIHRERPVLSFLSAEAAGENFAEKAVEDDEDRIGGLRLRRHLRRLWRQPIRRPGQVLCEANGEGQPPWPAYSREERRNMVLGAKIEATPIERADAYDVFERHWMQLIEATRRD